MFSFNSPILINSVDNKVNHRMFKQNVQVNNNNEESGSLLSYLKRFSSTEQYNPIKVRNQSNSTTNIFGSPLNYLKKLSPKASNPIQQVIPVVGANGLNKKLIAAVDSKESEAFNTLKISESQPSL